MKPKHIRVLAIALTLVVIIGAFLFQYFQSINNEIRLVLPLNKALIPADFAAPTFSWKDNRNEKGWIITFNLKNKKEFYKATVNQDFWRPDSVVWESIKKESRFSDIEVTIERASDDYVLFKDKSKTKISISKDSVAAAILYRQIPLPFSFAEQNIEKTSYSVHDISSTKPFHNVLGSFKVCGNCHSSSHDGTKLALDFDAVSRDKGGYFVSKIDTVINYDINNYVSWSKYTGRNTFGLLSRISFNGRYVVTTVKDRVVSEKLDGIKDMPYSQLFFPVNGVLAIYDTETGKLAELPGANDPNYVQSNAIWTADDKYIIFARAKAIPFPKEDTIYDSFFRNKKDIQLFAAEKKEFKYDLYIIPFNNGKGGVAKPIEGASFNGKSNYFPTVSPDGKWIVFCQANNFMMLRPDSKLYIVPVTGGKARVLDCNFNSMNSWHSWSPNGKWLVFTSKVLSMYTDMFLTHIDEEGNASIPVLIENAKRPECAINYPEFINRPSNYKFTMKYQYINLMDIEDLVVQGKKKEAKDLLNKYIIQGKMGVPAEYRGIARIFYALGDQESYMKYVNLADNLEKNFSKKIKE